MPDQLHTTGWKPGTSNHDHHRGIYKEYIGSSGLKTFADYSAAHYREGVNNPGDPTPALMTGNAFHSMALGFPEEISVIPQHINRRTKVGKEQWAAYQEYAKDKYQVKQSVYNNLAEMVEALHRHPIAKRFLQYEEREITGIWHDVNNRLNCKIRPDLMSHNQRVIVDLKTTLDASRKVFNRDIFKYGYHVSATWYKYGAQQITGNDYNFIIVAVEKKPPYGINCFNISGLAIKKAWQKIGECLGDIADAYQDDKWPNYEPRLWNIDVPSYII